MLIEKSKATQWRLQPAINRRILPSVVLKTQKCECAQENNRQLLSFALFHICSHPPSPKPDDTAWGIPLQRRSQMVHFWMDWRRQHGSGCRRSSWTVPYSAPESAVVHNNNLGVLPHATSTSSMQLCLSLHSTKACTLSVREPKC